MTLLIVLSLLGAPARSSAQAPAAEPNEKALKYHSALLRRPSPDYLFERFYYSWLDTGSLSGLEAFLTERAKATDRPGHSAADHLLLAYFHSRQGDSENARGQFRAALAISPNNARAWLQLAQADARNLEFREALTSLERALGTQPAPPPALRNEIRQLQGKFLARDHRRDEAAKIWQSLIAEQPDNEELREDLIELQLGEGLVEEATQATKDLIAATRDPHKAVLRRMRLGEIERDAGKDDLAVATFAACLDKVGAGSWLEREIYAQIEGIFRRSDDLSGLETFYSKRLESTTPSLALRQHHAELLAALGKGDEAVEAFRKILAVTPGDRPSREAFIDLLTSLGKTGLALEQLDALIAQSPDDGELILRKADLQFRARDTEACEQLVAEFLDKSQRTESDHLRACRLLEQYQLREAADKAYQAASSAFPDSVVVLDAQAAHLHKTRRQEEAVAIWKKLAAGGDGSRVVLVARALSSRQEFETAFEILHARVDEFDDDPSYLGLLCDQASQLKRFAEALPWSRTLVRLAQTPGEMETANMRTERLARNAEQSDELIAELERTATTRTPQESCLLAELYETRGEHERAEATLGPVVDSHPLIAGTQLVRLYELRHEWRHATGLLIKLTELPGGRKSTYIRRIVDLARRSGEDELAMEWLPEWKKTSPGSTLPWLAEARLHLDREEPEVAIRTLRLASLQFEDDSNLRAQLARIYVDQEQFAEAQRIFQRLYDEADTPETKQQWIAEVARVAEKRDGVNELVETFEKRRRNNHQSLSPLMALAEIYRVTGNYELRRSTLYQASRLKPDDIDLLHRIAQLEASNGDQERALATLQRAAKIDRGTGTLQRIARLHLKSGDEDEAYRVIAEVAAAEKVDARGAEKLAESMVMGHNWEAVLEFLAPYRQKFPDDFRLDYLNAVALEESGHEEQALEQFTSLLERTAGTRPAPVPTHLADLGPGAPAGMIEVLSYIHQSRDAYAYRRHSQLPQSWQQSQSTPSVRLPPDLPALRPLALAHLIDLSRNLSRAHRQPLMASVRRHGFRETELLFEIQPGTSALSADQVADLIEQYPANPTLIALAIHHRVGINHLDLDHWLGGFEMFEPSHPELAFCCAMIAASFADERVPATLERALELAEELEHATPDMIHYAHAALGSAGGVLPPNDLGAIPRQKLSRRLVAWSADHRKQADYANAYFSRTTFALTASEDLPLLVDYLDEELAATEVAFATLLVPGFGPIFSFGETIELVPMKFPPRRLPGIASHALDYFFPYEPSGGNSFSLDPQKTLAALPRTDSTILKIYLAKAADLDEEVAALIRTIEEQPDPPLAERVLTAAYHGSQGRTSAALDLLVATAEEPTDPDSRQQIDSSIIAWSSELAAQDESRSAELLAIGREAALRMRHTIASSEERDVLAQILESLGLKKEAARLVVTRQPRPQPFLFPSATISSVHHSPSTTILSRSFRSSRIIRSGSTQFMLIASLIEEGKKDRALRVILSEMRAEVRRRIAPTSTRLAPAQTFQAASWSDWKEFIHAQTLTDEILKPFAPGDSTSARKHLEFAVASELLGRDSNLTELQRKAHELDPEYQSAMMLLAPRIAREEPEVALAMMLKLRPLYLSRAGDLLRDQVGAEDQFWPPLVELTAELLGQLENPHRHQLGWVESIANVGFTPAAEEPQAASEREAAARLTGAMLTVRQLANEGFRLRALRREVTPESLPGLLADARQALSNAAPAGPPISREPEREQSIAPEQLISREAWRSRDREGLDQFTAELRSLGNRRQAENLAYLSSLYFDVGEPFLKSAQGFHLKRQGGFSYSRHDALDTIVAIWRERELDLDLGKFLLSQLPRAPHLDPGHLVTHAESINATGGREAMDQFLDQLVTAYLGDADQRRADFEEARQESLQPKKSLRHRRGTSFSPFGSPSPTSESTRDYFGNCIEALLASPTTSFSALSIYQEHVGPYNEIGASPFNINLARCFLTSPDELSSAEEWIAALRSSPFFCPLEEFHTFAMPKKHGSSAFGLLVMNIANLPSDKKSDVVKFIRSQAPSFGRNLILSSIGESPVNAYTLLARHTAEIDALPADRQRMLAAVSFALDEPPEVAGADTLAIYKRFVAIRPGGEVDQRRTFLAASKWDPARIGQRLVTLTWSLLPDRRDEAHRLFRHGVDLLKVDPGDPVPDGKSRPGSWVDDLYKINKTPEALAFALELIAARESPQIELYHPDALGERFFDTTKLQKGRPPKTDELVAAVTRLEPHVQRPETLPLLTGAVLDYLAEASPDLRGETVARLEEFGEFGIPFARAAALGGDSPDVGYFLDVLSDEAISLSARTAVYGMIAKGLGERTPEAITRAGAALVAASWEQQVPVPYEISRRMLPMFFDLGEHDAAWQTTGSLLARAWHPVRNGGDTITSSHLLAIGLECGESESADRLISTPRKDGMTPDASWVQILIKHHELELAKKVLIVHWKRFGLPDCPPAFRFDDSFDQNGQELLPMIDEVDIHYFAKLVIAASLDHRIPDQVRAEQQREARIVAVAADWPDDLIQYTPTRQRLLALISAYPRAADEIPQVYTKAADKIGFASFYDSGRNTNPADPDWFKNRVFVTHLRQGIAQRDTQAVARRLAQLEAKQPASTPNESEFEIAAGAVLEAIQQNVLANWHALEPHHLAEIARQWREFLARHPRAEFRVVSSDRGEKEIDFATLETFGFTLLVHTLAGEPDELQLWRDSLDGRAKLRWAPDPPEAEIVRDSFRNFAWAFDRARLNPELRTRLTRKLLEDPILALAIPSPETGKRLVREHGLLTEDQLDGLD